MKRRNVKARRAAWALTGSASALLLAGALFAPAQATPDKDWWLGYVGSTSGTPDFAAAGDLIVSDNVVLKFTGTYNGNTATVDCNISTTGFVYTVTGSERAGSGQWFTIDMTPPSGTLGGCTEDVTSSAVNVTFDTSDDWTVRIQAPSPDGTNTGDAHTGTLTGQIIVPEDNVTAVMTGLPCTVVGPTGDSLTVQGTYDPLYSATSGLATKGSAYKDFDLDISNKGDCPLGGDWAVLDNGSVELHAEIDNGPGNPPTIKVPTAVWKN